MFSLFTIFIGAAYLAIPVTCASNDGVLQVRQLQTISDVNTSSSTKSTTRSSSTTSGKSSSVSSTVTTTKGTITTTSSASRTGYDLALTTTFTPPPGCSGLTEFATATDYLYRNVINPTRAASITSCYPSQFWSSAVASVSLSAFSQLICPVGYTTTNLNSTYIVCCPYGFAVGGIDPTHQDRPAELAYCYSRIPPAANFDVQLYPATGSPSKVSTSAGTEQILVIATAFDGRAAPTQSGSTKSTTTASSSSSVSSTSTRTSIVSTTTTSKSSASSTVSKPTTSTQTSTITSRATGTRTTTPAKPSSTACTLPSTTTKFSTTTTKSPPTTTTASTLNPSTLPSCGQTCLRNMVNQYSTLGCASPDPFCLCGKPNFGYGLRDCANGACGTATASTIISYGSAYCVSATSSVLPTSATILPSCGRTCLGNMFAQYSNLGCAAPTGSCLCKKPDFSNGLRDCADGACGTAVGSTAISFGSVYCASATATSSRN